MAFDKEKYIVRCTKCVVGHKAGKPIGGVISYLGEGRSQCCNCGQVYRKVTKIRPYHPDQFSEQIDQAF